MPWEDLSVIDQREEFAEAIWRQVMVSRSVGSVDFNYPKAIGSLIHANSNSTCTRRPIAVAIFTKASSAETKWTAYLFPRLP
jgi:hypothetical protein